MHHIRGLRYLVPLLWVIYGLSIVRAFSHQDYEIFRINDEIALAEGSGISFYDILGVDRKASQDEISKAYRKQSRVMHPDKVKQSFITAHTASRPARIQDQDDSTFSKQRSSQSKTTWGLDKDNAFQLEQLVQVAQQRYARLGVVANILKGSGRERYDFFLSNGFPAWKGTGYYYARFRPGLGTVLLGLFLFFGGFVHYVCLYVSRMRQKAFMQRFVDSARREAHVETDRIQELIRPNGNGNPVSNSELASRPEVMNRRQKRWQDKESKREHKAAGKVKDEVARRKPPVKDPQSRVCKRVQAENGRMLLVEAEGNVFLEEVDAEGKTAEILLDPNEIETPRFKDTLVYSLPSWLLSTLVSSTRARFQRER